MKKPRLSHRGRIILLLSVQTAIILGVFFLRLAALQSKHLWLQSLCDGLFAGGTVFLAAGLISVAASRGGLDGFFYICRIVGNMFLPERAVQGRPRFISFSEYLQSQEKREYAWKPLLIIGSASFAVSAVLYAVLTRFD